MESLVWIFIAYVVVAGVWARMYFARRHGLGWGYDPGAGLIAIFWPVTVFTHWSPRLCTHRSCVYRRVQLRAEDTVVEQGLREEGRL